MSDVRRVPKPGGVKAHPRLDGESKLPGNEPVKSEKHDRNAPCPCGSGKKFKKCCADGKSLWVSIKEMFGMGA